MSTNTIDLSFKKDYSNTLQRQPHHNPQCVLILSADLRFENPTHKTTNSKKLNLNLSNDNFPWHLSKDPFSFGPSYPVPSSS